MPFEPRIIEPSPFDLRAAVVPGPPEKPGDDAGHDAHEAPARMSWARLLKRVFGTDLEHCPQCGGELKIIAAIEESAVIVRILTTRAILQRG